MAANRNRIENASPMIFSHYLEKLIATDKACAEWVEPDRLGFEKKD